MQSVPLHSVIAPKSSAPKQILFPTVLNRKDLEDLSSTANDDVMDLDLRGAAKVQATLSAPYVSAFAASPIIADIPFTTSSSLAESDLKKMQIMNQLVTEPILVMKALGSSEAEPYQLSALRDDDRSFFSGCREGFQEVFDYVNLSSEMLESKCQNDASATSLLSLLRQVPAQLTIDWLEGPKIRGTTHDVVNVYKDATLASVVNFLATDFAVRNGIPTDNFEMIKSPVILNAAMKAASSSSAKTPIFSPEALEKMIEWCQDVNPAKAALTENDKSKVKDKDKAKVTKSPNASLQDVTKVIQLMLRFLGASSDIQLHAKNGFLSSIDGVRLSPLIFSRGSRTGFASEWFNAIRSASFERGDRRDDHRTSRANDRNNNRGRSREKTDKK